MPLLEALDKTLDELDPPTWGEPDYDSHLAATCHQLRRKPLRDYSVEDLRIMIDQRIGLEWLLPMAIEILEREPLAEGDLYTGDLLASVLRVDADFWATHLVWRDRLQQLLEGVPELPNDLGDAAAEFAKSCSKVLLQRG